MKRSSVVMLVFAGLVVLVGLPWFVQGQEFFLYRYFAPKTEQVRREVFEQSKAYNQGMVQELQNMQFEYVKAEPEHKNALASIILHRVADYPQDKLPADLRTFIQGLRADALNGVSGK